VRRVEVGFRTVSPGPPARYQAVTDESLMLTGDENIVDIQFIVQYRIKDAASYLFNVMGPDTTVKDVAEASMRQVVGRSMIEEALTTGKFKLQQDTKQLMQIILDNYGVGIAVDAVQLQDVHPPREVIQAFKDVASAKEDKIKYINDAQGYANDILPKANGKAAEIVNEALAYQQTKINYSEGDASRFLQTLTEFSTAAEITKKRMYIEAMEEVLEGAQKFIIPEKMGNLLPLLPLKGLSTGGQPVEGTGKEEK
jgi:modulator of FtsH protease HflK